MRSWKGKSGSVYPVGILEPREALDGPQIDGVAIAIRREDSGLGKGLAVPVGKPMANPSASWIRGMESKGATEIHVHQPAVGVPLAAIVEDLGRGA